jgi:hypothetical protein
MSNQDNNPALVAWVAEHVMGWKCFHHKDHSVQDIDDVCSNGGYGAIVEYSPEGDVLGVVPFDAEFGPMAIWLPFADAHDDLMVLRKVREWLDAADVREGEGLWNRFWHHLSERLRSRDPYYRGTLNQYELYYMTEYQCGDYCVSAALAAGYKPCE